MKTMILPSLILVGLITVSTHQALSENQQGLNLTETKVNESYGSVKGVTMFRGNPTRSWYGTGPLPSKAPRRLWRYPEKPLCSSSTTYGKASTWCGTGWTGQPVVWERPDGITEVIVGAYDRAVHFINAETGKPTRTPFMTGDLIKGSVTLDPDGFPLLYFGSRDNKLRIVALDREKPTELYFEEGNTADRMWDNDWDGNPAIINDHLIEGGENSWFYVLKLNRAFDVNKKVTVNPKRVVRMRGWTDQLLTDLGDRTVSIENSVAVQGNRAFFANSGGLVTGVNLANIKDQTAEIIFRYWVGDDVDASTVIDKDGMIYIAAEYERKLPRAKQAGQLMKLNPDNNENPVVWKIDLTNEIPGSGKQGIWATPVLDSHNNMLYVPTHGGNLLGVNTRTGEQIFKIKIGSHEWSSPSLVDNKLLVGLCASSGLRLYDLADIKNPTALWTVNVGGCVESTPVVWKGRIYVGSRDGYIYGFGE